MARWASEFGIVNSSTRLPPKVAVAPKTAAIATIQMTTVRHPWRAHARPRRARAPSWRPRGGVVDGVMVLLEDRDRRICDTNVAAR